MMTPKRRLSTLIFAFFYWMDKTITEFARNLVQHVDLNYSMAPFLPLLYFPFAISLNDNWFRAVFIPLKLLIFWNLFNDICVLASVD